MAKYKVYDRNHDEDGEYARVVNAIDSSFAAEKYVEDLWSEWDCADRVEGIVVVDQGSGEKDEFTVFVEPRPSASAVLNKGDTDA